jgi:hypothetical protein
VEASAGEEPDDHEAGEALDEAVDAEADQRDRAGPDARGDRDRELDQVPGVAGPREQPGAPLQVLALAAREDGHPPERRQLERALAHPHERSARELDRSTSVNIFTSIDLGGGRMFELLHGVRS